MKPNFKNFLNSKSHTTARNAVKSSSAITPIKQKVSTATLIITSLLCLASAAASIYFFYRHNYYLAVPLSILSAIFGSSIDRAIERKYSHLGEDK